MCSTASARFPRSSAAGVATAELLDAASLRVAGADPACPEVIRRLENRWRDHAALLVELQAASSDGARRPARRGRPRRWPAAAGAAAAELTTDAAERAALWRTRKGLYSAVAGARPSGTNALLEDVAVPVDRLGDLSRGLTGCSRRTTTATR